MMVNGFGNFSTGMRNRCPDCEAPTKTPGVPTPDTMATLPEIVVARHVRKLAALVQDHERCAELIRY